MHHRRYKLNSFLIFHHVGRSVSVVEFELKMFADKSLCSAVEKYYQSPVVDVRTRMMFDLNFWQSIIVFATLTQQFDHRANHEHLESHRLLVKSCSFLKLLPPQA